MTGSRGTSGSGDVTRPSSADSPAAALAAAGDCSKTPGSRSTFACCAGSGPGARWLIDDYEMVRRVLVGYLKRLGAREEAEEYADRAVAQVWGMHVRLRAAGDERVLHFSYVRGAARNAWIDAQRRPRLVHVSSSAVDTVGRVLAVPDELGLDAAALLEGLSPRERTVALARAAGYHFREVPGMSKRHAVMLRNRARLRRQAERMAE